MLLSACSHIPDENIKDLSGQVLIKSLAPELEKILQKKSPVFNPDKSSYPIIQKIPGPTFDLKKANQNTISFDQSGNFLLSSGDYVIPAMTYCMNQSGNSPDGHLYSLSKMQGKRAQMIQRLHSAATSKFSFEDIQITSWSLQAGLSYQEMTRKSQKIIDEVIPDFKPELKESLLKSLEKKWNNIADKSHDIVPSFNQSIDDLLNQLGDTGKEIKEIKDFKNKLDEVGHNYAELSQHIETTPSSKKGQITPWSKLSENIYARFVIDGHFGDIGFIQIRVIPISGRKINSDSTQKFALDLSTLLANSNDPSVQSLSITPLIGFAGIISHPALIRNPTAAALLLALALIVKPMNWDDFFKLEELLKDVDDKNVENEIRKGNQVLQKEHDELEKPLKEAGIISGKTKNTSIKGNPKVREYTKSGGMEQLEKDFAKMPGKLSKAGDGTEIKTLPDGTTIVKSPGSNNGPTLEIQPPKNNAKYPDSRIRVKVRYK